MKLSVEFPSIAFREGPAAVVRMAQAIETIGYDALDVFDHVAMGYPAEGRDTGPYPAKMPILEALMLLAYAAAVTSRVKLGTEVLVLPQRAPVLLAKQLSTLDTLSGGRVRFGIGVGWQRSEFEALGEDFGGRGKRNDEAMALLRACWGDEVIDFDSSNYKVEAMAMEPKPPQGAKLPIWVGGNSEIAYRRVGRLGDGWMASRISDAKSAQTAIDAITRHAEAAGRDPASIGLQSMVAPPPRSEDTAGKRFYADTDQVVARISDLNAMGFHWAAINATAIFQAGARSVDGMIEQLQLLHDKVRAEVG
ncbi:MAG: TIGR03619 family F420-dependent LLM class oxidoreductase [Chromatiales bacterium]|jgi:probable F420-dependent oxidoreductase|nr:TIGR03619 family F420-dependent LLM class oxidoreductase [Chromatiales bacterium]